MTRTPKRGEVWTSDAGSPFTCIDAEPDRTECYGWRSPLGHKFYKPVAGWTPPKAESPEWLADVVVNVYATHVAGHTSATGADAERLPSRLGTVRLDPRTWAPT